MSAAKKPVNVELIHDESALGLDVYKPWGLNARNVQRVVLKLPDGSEVALSLRNGEVSIFVRGDELVVSPNCIFAVTK
jgi:hypothetical protein